MRYVWLLGLAFALALTGCTKNDAPPNAAPGRAPNDSSGTAGDPNAGTGAGGGAAPAPGAANGQPAGGGTAAKPPADLPMVTRAQYDQIAGALTLDQFTQQVGTPGKLIADTGDKKTYQFQLKDDPKYYANFVFKNNVFLEKSLFTL